METKTDEKVNSAEDRVKILINSLSKFKVNYMNDREEFKKLRETNEKLEVQLKEARELEKSHRYHLLKSREMIGNLQETVSQLVYLKRDIMKLKDEMAVKDTAIAAVEKDKENLIQKNKESISELRAAHETKIKELTAEHEKKIQQVQHETDTQIAQYSCFVEELKAKIKEMEKEHKDKMNMVVLEYEEKIQRGEAQNTQLQDELARRAARAEANFEAYRRRMEELEEQLKQSKFRQFLAKTTYMSQIENPVDHSCSDFNLPYFDKGVMNQKEKPCQDNSSTKLTKIPSAESQTKRNSQQNSLKVLYNDIRSPMVSQNLITDKKPPFNITKKRKLYTDKEFQ